VAIPQSSAVILYSGFRMIRAPLVSTKSSNPWVRTVAIKSARAGVEPWCVPPAPGQGLPREPPCRTSRWSTARWLRSTLTGGHRSTRSGTCRSIETFASPLHCAPSSQVALIAETPNTRVSATTKAFRQIRRGRAKLACLLIPVRINGAMIFTTCSMSGCLADGTCWLRHQLIEESLVFQSAADSPAQMIWFDRSGKELGQIPQTGYLDPSLSPDGNLLAVSSDEEHNGKHFVRIIDLRTGIVTGLTQGGDEHNPCWTPDGKFVTYRSGTNQTASIEHVPVDRSSPARTLLRGFNVKPNSWSHDGHLLYTDFSLNGPARKSYSASTGEAVPVDDEAESQHSPDGKWVAVSGTNVFVQLAKGPGRRIQVSSGPAGGYQPRWSHDGKRIFYIQTDRKLMEADFDGEKGIASAPHLLFQTHIIQSRATLPQYDVAPDGRFLINSFPAGNGAPLTLLTGWTALLKKH
jgi:hypothetical protein